MRCGQRRRPATYTALTVNDRTTSARLLIEVPDKPYADALGHGVHYKALSTSTFAYLGEDPPHTRTTSTR